jgi:hypothetical protein
MAEGIFTISEHINVSVKKSQFAGSGGYVNFFYKGADDKAIWLNTGSKAWAVLREHLPLIKEQFEAEIPCYDLELSTTVSVNMLCDPECGDHLMQIVGGAHGWTKTMNFNKADTARLMEVADSIDASMVALEPAAKMTSHHPSTSHFNGDEDSTKKRKLDFETPKHGVMQMQCNSPTLVPLQICEPRTMIVYRYVIRDLQEIKEQVESSVRYRTRARAMEEAQKYIEARCDFSLLNYKTVILLEEVEVPSAYVLITWVFQLLIRIDLLKEASKTFFCDKCKMVSSEGLGVCGCPGVYETDFAEEDNWDLLVRSHFYELKEKISVTRLAIAFEKVTRLFGCPATSAAQLAEAAMGFPLTEVIRKRVSTPMDETIDIEMFDMMHECLSQE